MTAQERFQDNLLLIRRILGWTAEEFGERIGVTRQTINNLEAKPKDGKRRATLNKTQYIAMRAVIDAEMAESSEDFEMLKLILDAFVDNPDKYTEKDKNTLIEKANMLAPSILAGTTTRDDVSKEYHKRIGEIGAGIVLAAVPIVGAWLIYALKDK